MVSRKLIFQSEQHETERGKSEESKISPLKNLFLYLSS